MNGHGRAKRKHEGQSPRSFNARFLEPGQSV